MPGFRIKKQLNHLKKLEQCVYTNPNYDYKKSRHVYNLKYSCPGFVEVGDQGSPRTVVQQNRNWKFSNMKLLTSIGNPKTRSHKLKPNNLLFNKKKLKNKTNRPAAAAFPTLNFSEIDPK